ncbi:MAG: sigma-70 family RNA polymerase sigma factor [Planctomycetota bacterium]|nr:sigma-70 family RNA polymerase sigma factor [Planctomycetota bacterium]
MSPPDRSSDSRHAGGKSFATTHWSLVLAAGHGSRPDAGAALATLCEAYWYPLYYYVRRRGYRAEEAQDLTQAFFAVILEKGSLKVADPDRGRFRSFLLASLNHFLANEWRRASARKRGGGKPAISLDAESAETRYRREPAHDLTPERAYERRWALLLLEKALSTLRDEYAASGKAAAFARLSGFLAGREHVLYEKAARELGMTEGAVKVAVHRLRRRCRAILRAEVAQTVADPADVDGELRHLMAAVGQ